MWRSGCLSLLIACSSCGPSGPKVTWCLTGDPFECSDYKGTQFSKSVDEVDGWACLGHDHLERLLSRCKQGLEVGRISFCVVDSPSRMLLCDSGEDMRVDKVNFGCASPTDTRRLLEYCRLKRER